MKVTLILKNAVAAVVVCSSLFFAACATTGKVSHEFQDFNLVKGNVWQLVKVSDSSGAIINRSARFIHRETTGQFSYWLTPFSSVNNLLPGEHLEILVYRNAVVDGVYLIFLRQHLLRRQVIQPVFIDF